MKRVIGVCLILILLSGCAKMTPAFSSAVIEQTPAVTMAEPSAQPSIEPSVPPQSPPKAAVWTGTWKRLNPGHFYGATLAVSNETPDKFDFVLDAYNGANMGRLRGIAGIQGNIAEYTDSKTGAVLTFCLDTGSGDMTLEANASANAQAGYAVTYDGTYTMREMPDVFTLLHAQYVRTPQQEQDFIAMAGDDVKLFLNTAQYSAKTDDLDGFGAEVQTWWVRGVASWCASIVIFLPDGKLCAAVNCDNPNIVKVYTNASYIQSVPKTIAKWNTTHENRTMELICK